MTHSHESTFNGVDPTCINWASVDLPETWPDKLNFRNFTDLCLFIRKLRGKQIEQVKISEQLPLNVPLPKYLLQEFHNLPNGNYSKKISRGYSTGFDISMLGRMKYARTKLAQDLASCTSVLDVGCGGGHTAARINEAGIKDIWGLDPSPYLLQHAARDYPSIKFIQGLAEQTGFVDSRFNGISACFVFHEIPPRFTEQALSEFYRILRSGGLVSIVEPAPEQMYYSYLQMLRKFGITGLYFKMLAKKAHEPFVHAWHKQNYHQWASAHGFELIQDMTQMPFRYLLLKRQ